MPSAKNSSTKSKKPAAAPKAEPRESAYDPNEARRTVLSLKGRYGVVDNARRAAYASLITDAQRAELGSRTRGANVAREAVVWAVAIGQAFTAYPAAVEEHYARPRFAYYLDRLGALIDAVEAQQAQRGGTTATRSTASEREQLAREGRTQLSRKMKRVVGARQAELEALQAASGTTDTIGALGKSIVDLASLARKWMALTDPSWKILCGDAGLTEEFIQQVVAAGEALTGAAVDETLAGRLRGTDTPEVNLLEGSVLHEMAAAQDAFDDAHEASQVVARLIAGPATRSVLGPRKAAKASDQATTGVAPAANPA